MAGICRSIKEDLPELTTIRNVVTGKNKTVVTLTEAINSHIQHLDTRVGIYVFQNTEKKYESARKRYIFIQSQKAFY